MSAENFLKNLFGVHVAVLCTDDAQKIAQKNNLTFCEMLRPFSQLPVEVGIRDQQGHMFYAKDMRVKFSEPMREVGSDSKLRLLLDSAVHDTESLIPEAENRRAYSPWYEHYRDTFLEHMQVGEQEYLRHYLCNLFVVSSKSEDVLADCKRLYDTQVWMKEHYSYSHWFNQAVDYYLVLHDNQEGDVNRTQGIMSKLKSQHGNRCSVLAVNSRVQEEGGASFLSPWSRFVLRKTAIETVQSPVKLSFQSTSVQSVPNGPLKTSEARGEAQLIDIDDSTPSGEEIPSQEEMSDPLRHPKSGGIPQESATGSENSVVFGQYCNSDDHETLRKFVVDLTKQILLSTLNVMQKALSEPVQARKASVGKFWNKSWKSLKNMTSSGTSLPPIYQSDSHELQARQLADVCMLLHNYDYAYQLYHTLKGDFKSDKAWLHYAGALELAAVSCFMHSQKVITTYFDDAISLYLNSAESPHFAFRAQLIYCDLLKSQRRFREAAWMFVRMSSETNKSAFLVNSDLKSALAFEEAANCFLQDGMHRKYCLYIMLAAHRYNKARHPIHGARALKSVLSVLKGKTWNLSEVFVQTTLARHCCQREMFEEARCAYESILTNTDHRHTLAMQLPLCKEYIFVLKQIYSSSHHSVDLSKLWSTSSSEDSIQPLPLLVVPDIVSSEVTVIFSATSTCPGCPFLKKGKTEQEQLLAANYSNVFTISGYDQPKLTLSDLVCRGRNRTGDPTLYSISLTGVTSQQLSEVDLSQLRKLEKMAAGCVGEDEHSNSGLEPCVLFMNSRTPNTRRPYCVVNEPVAVEVTLKNHLQIPLMLTDLTLVWKLEPVHPGIVLAPGDSVTTEVIPKVTMDSNEHKQVCFHVIPLKEGVIHVVGVVYNLSINQSSPVLQRQAKEETISMETGIQGHCKLAIKGPRLNESLLERTSVTYGLDHRLSWAVCPPAPQLKVHFRSCPSWMLAGEIALIPLVLDNIGQKGLTKLTFSLSQEHLFSVVMGREKNVESSPPCGRQPCLEFSLPDSLLHPAQSHQCEVMIQASHTSHTPQPCTLDWVFYYEPVEEISGLSHRVVPFSHPVAVKPSLGITCSVHPSYVTPKSTGKSLLLSLEIENQCTTEAGSYKMVEMKIIQLTCISRYGWTVHPLDPNQGAVQLWPNQTGFLTCKASCDSKPATEDSVNLQYTSHSLGVEKEVALGSYPSCDLFCQSEEYTKLTREEIQGQDFQEKGIVLAVLWEASIPVGSSTRLGYGVHYVWIDLPLPSKGPVSLIDCDVCLGSVGF
jgi:hypothetical protein